jgi:hypothetical protein
MRQARIDSGMVVEIADQPTLQKGFVAIGDDVRLGWLVAGPVAPATSAKIDSSAFYPPAVTPLQVRKALRQLGLKGAVEGIIETLSEEIREEWEYASMVRLNDAALLAVAAVLKLTEADRQALLRRAAAL